MKTCWLWGPLAFALLLCALAKAPLGRPKVPRGGPGDELIVPLNARDPSALVMGPSVGKYPAPPIQKPR